MSPTSLPTPAPSTEILPGKKTSLTSYIDASFTLPPAAIVSNVNDSTSATSPSPANSDSSYRPISPPSTSTTTAAPSRAEKAPVTTRSSSGNNRNVNHLANQNGYTIPPPPTRSRKIIQMKPQPKQGPQDENVAQVKGQPATGPTQGPQTSNSKPAATAAGSKRKQPGGQSTAQGRKIARKTAHSLIERRRRSKMNEEFGVLKDMIPACRGQEMHKLAILQASIEYMHYLEQCLGDLKAAHSHCRPTDTSNQQSHIQSSVLRATTFSNVTPTANSTVEDDSDEDMYEATSPQSAHPRSGVASSAPSHQPSISPAILPSTHTSPAISSKHRTYSSQSAYSSALPSPAFEPHTQALGPGYSTFQLTSPALGPQDGNPGSMKSLEKDDHEATAALLMLNTDRRSWSGPSGGRGMSVKDLLSG